jgi:hypothetical protein
VSAVLRSSRRTPPSPTRAPRRSRRSRAAARGPARRRLPVTDNSRALPPECREGQAFRRRRFRRYSPPQGAPPHAPGWTQSQAPKNGGAVHSPLSDFALEITGHTCGAAGGDGAWARVSVCMGGKGEHPGAAAGGGNFGGSRSSHLRHLSARLPLRSRGAALLALCRGAWARVTIGRC